MRLAVTTLVFCAAALLALGMVMLYSSSMAQVGARYLVMQMIWCVLGLGSCLAAIAVDYRLLKKLVWPLFGLAVLMLVLVRIPHIGTKVNGAWRWFSLGPVRFQPSEFAKLALIIAVAWYGDRFQRQMPTLRRGVLIPGAFIGLMLGLIFIEPDWGSTILLAGVGGAMLLIAGVRWRYILPPVAMGAGALGFLLWHNPMRIKRIFGWLHLEETKSGIGYQAYQARLALGSGGWFGLGLGNGRQKLGWVPEHHTDFILSIIGEELGLVATLLVVLAFVILFICGLQISWQATDTFGLLLGSGITFLITLQAAINIGVVTNTLPNKGLPLPFISYGGSDLLIMLICIGLLLSVARQVRDVEPLTQEGDDEEAFSDPNPFRARPLSKPASAVNAEG
jgi:cell division protein FtsW